LSEPAVEPTYRDEKGSSSALPPPRPDGEYRLPPLTFDRPSPNMSTESQPRSLTPITERTDDASRQNSTRTNNSAVYERRPSENSKQGSGSSRIPSGEERLAPITDEEQVTDEPELVTSPEDTHPNSAAIVRGVGTQETLDSQTGDTVWSQSSAPASASGASTPTTSHAHPSTAAFAKLPPIVTSAGKPMELERPNDDQSQGLPAGARDGTHDSGSHVAPSAQATVLAPTIDTDSDNGSRNARSITPQGQTAAISQAQHPSLGQSQGRPLDGEVHAPTPRKVSPGEHISSPENDLQREPAAVYLQNMVDEPQSQTQPTSTQQLAPAPRDTRVRSPSDTGSLNGIGRKPSGARAPPPRKSSTGPLRSLSAVDEHGQPIALSPPVSAVGGATQETTPKQPEQTLPRSTTHDDLGEDVSAYVAYAEQSSPEMDKGKGKAKELPVPIKEEEGPRSSFALSKAAQDRRAKADALAAEQERAKRVPGGGKRTGPMVKKDEWMESDSDEDEDEEEQSPEVPRRAVAQTRGEEYQDGLLERSGSRARALPSIPQPQPPPRVNGGYTPDQERYDRQRPQSHSPHPQSREDRDRTSMAPPRSQYDQRPQGRTPPPNAQQQQQQLQQSQNRQSVWNANFAADHGMTENKTGKFVEMEDPAAQLTKPFAPHGLLQAGLQDREDRSAKRQEELARETGTSLINVPSKPPPPQTGLLGAVAAHERERKNAGGIGATLTDRERERRQHVSLLMFVHSKLI